MKFCDVLTKFILKIICMTCYILLFQEVCFFIIFNVNGNYEAYFVVHSLASWHIFIEYDFWHPICFQNESSIFRFPDYLNKERIDDYSKAKGMVCDLTFHSSQIWSFCTRFSKCIYILSSNIRSSNIQQQKRKKWIWQKFYISFV